MEKAETWREYLPLVHRLADASGAVILRYFRQTLAIEDKDHVAGYSPVTVADREAESTIRALIEEACPGHGILGEEYGHERPDARYHLGHRPDRRHQGVHFRHDDLGHVDRAAGPRTGHRRRAEPALPRRAVRGPRRGCLSGRSPARHARLPRAERGGPLRDRARHVHAGRAGRLRVPSPPASACGVSVPIVTPTGCSPPASSIWWSRRA